VNAGERCPFAEVIIKRVSKLCVKHRHQWQRCMYNGLIEIEHFSGSSTFSVLSQRKRLSLSLIFLPLCLL
jgi:hypothetical protein